MGYGKQVYEESIAQLEQRKRNAEEKAVQAREAFHQRFPRAAEIREEMAANAAKAAKAVISGGSVQEELTRMKDRGLSLRREYGELLTKAGLTQQDVSPQYVCPDCQDTGFVDGRPCRCLKRLQRDMAYKKLSLSVPLKNTTFASFSLDYYRDDPQCCKQMEKVFHACKNYGEKFGPDSPSLLFRGKTGLGKTHLSLAIANEAIEKGYGVIYGSAQSFAVALEKERFTQEDPEAGDTVNAQLLSCDLLILDDLGTEFPSNYVNAALYNVVNLRMLSGKPTIISTNLSMKELQERYSERFASRVAGYYGMLEFTGNDVRIQRRRKKASPRM